MKSLIITILFITCIVLTININKQHNKYIIEKVLKEKVLNEVFEWQMKYYDCEHTVTTLYHTIDYLDMVIDNLNSVEELRFHPMDSLIVIAP